MEKFTLIGVDGNAFAVMGYTARALREAGLDNDVEEMQTQAMSGDYDNLLRVCVKYVDKANEALGLED